MLSSCKTEKSTAYFQNRPDNSLLQTLITKDFEHKVRPGDILLLSFNSANPLNSALFNTSPEGYIVDKRGNINIYKLGEVNVQGLTLNEVKTKLSTQLTDYLKDLVIGLTFKNHKVLVMGEVNMPGAVVMVTEHLTILEALTRSGDLKESAKKDQILVIRETGNGKIFNRMSLLDDSIFNSPFYYLQADDIVYVEPDPAKKKKDNNTSQIVGYIISGLSIALLLFDRIK